MKSLRIILSFFIPLALLLSVLTGCKKMPDKYSSTFFAMDTVMEVTVYGDGAILSEAEKQVHELEKLFSVTDDLSTISILNRDKAASVPSSVAKLLLSTLELCEETNGAVDITVYPIVSAWGFTTDEKQVPPQEYINALLSHVNYEEIHINKESDFVFLEKNTSIDLGSVAKGYTGDCICELLKDNGTSSALINLGGNVQVIGSKPDGRPWNVAITNPLDPSSAVGYVSVTDKAVITSGAYQRFFEADGIRYHHIIDPSTGYPANSGLASVTVIGPSGMVCDALSTAFFVMGFEESADYWRTHEDLEVIWVDEGGTVYITEGIYKSFTKATGIIVKEVKR